MSDLYESSALIESIVQLLKLLQFLCGQTEKGTTTRLVTCLCMKAYLNRDLGSFCLMQLGLRSNRGDNHHRPHLSSEMPSAYVDKGIMF